jgi:transcription elongation factor Elf1
LKRHEEKSHAQAAGPHRMEYFFTCPYCWQEISMVLDTSVRRQTYVEDCEVCCNPIEVHYVIDDEGSIDFNARVLE